MPRKDDIQGLLRDRFQNFEAEPEVDLWKGIEAELYPEKQRSRKLWPYFSIAASIAILIFTWVYLGQIETSDSSAPAFVEETTPKEEQQEQTPVFTSPAEELEQEPQMAVEQEESSPEPEKRLVRDLQRKVEAPVAERKKSDQPLPQPLFNKQELMDRNIAKTELNQEKLEKEESATAVAPITKELFAEADVKKEQQQVKQPQAEQPQVEQVSATKSPKPVTETKPKSNTTLDLNNISFKNIVSLASDGIDKIKDASPVKVYEEKNDKGESKVYQLNLFNLSVSHKTQKRRNKKVRL